VPERHRVPAVQRPPAEIDERRDHDPDRELAHVLPHEADRAEERERGRDGPEEDLPEDDAAEAEHLLREGTGAGRDDDQLEHGPAEALEEVEPRREIGAAPPERGAHQHHRGHASVGADQAAEPEQHAAGERCRDDCAERIGKRERQTELVGRKNEERARDDHEQGDGEVRPEQEPVEEAEDAKPLGNGLDAPAWCVGVYHAAPFAGMTRIRFDGCDLSPRRGHPGVRTLTAHRYLCACT
jgi:hypothetical protein